jgi:hypothetical protein
VTTVAITSPFERVVEDDWVIIDGAGVVSTSTDVVTGLGVELELVSLVVECDVVCVGVVPSEQGAKRVFVG